MLPGALQGLLVLLTAVVSQAGSTQYHWDYIVVGAGPAGLQLGHFLQEAGRDYVILEKANVSGRSSFFDKAKKKTALCSCNPTYPIAPPPPNLKVFLGILEHFGPEVHFVGRLSKSLTKK